MASKQSIPPIHYFACASSLIALWPFRYLWNNPPRFAASHAWSVVLTAFTAYFLVVIGLTALMTICWRRLLPS
jgi:hypothetical protein